MILQVIGRLAGVRKGYNQPTNQSESYERWLGWVTPLRQSTYVQLRSGILVEGDVFFFLFGGKLVALFLAPPALLGPQVIPP